MRKYFDPVMLIGFAMLLVPLYAFAEAATLPALLPEDPASLVVWVRTHFDTGEYALAVGAIITVIVRLATATKKMQERLPPDVRKWLAMGIAMLTAIGSALLVGAGWMTAIVNGVLAGFTAVGGWEVAGKGIAPTPPTGPAT